MGGVRYLGQRPKKNGFCFDTFPNHVLSFLTQLLILFWLYRAYVYVVRFSGVPEVFSKYKYIAGIVHHRIAMRVQLQFCTPRPWPAAFLQVHSNVTAPPVQNTAKYKTAKCKTQQSAKHCKVQNSKVQNSKVKNTAKCKTAKYKTAKYKTLQSAKQPSAKQQSEKHHNALLLKQLNST